MIKKLLTIIRGGDCYFVDTVCSDCSLNNTDLSYLQCHITSKKRAIIELSKYSEFDIFEALL